MYDIPPDFLNRKVKNEKLVKNAKFYVRKIRFFVICDVIGSEIYPKIFFEEFFSFPK